VAQAPQTISFTAPATGNADRSATLTATGGGSGNPVTFSVDPSSGNDVCSVTAGTVSYLAGGTCVIDANQAGDANYLAATQVSQTITVDAAPRFTQDTPPLTAVAGWATVTSSSPQERPHRPTGCTAPRPGCTSTSKRGW